MTDTRLRTAALLLLALPLSAQELVESVPPEARLTNRILLVLDVSGSMAGPKLERAIAAALQVARAGTDELELSAIAFAGGYARWPAPQQEGSDAPRLWVECPDETAVSSLLAWLRTPLLADSSTHLAPALERALAEPRDKLSIVIVSDGELHDAQKALEVLRAGQAKREKEGLGLAVVACWTIGGDSPALNELAREGKGGCWREALPAPAPLPPGPFGPVQGSIR